MIDTHCHLEQPPYDKDREDVIALCRRQMSAVVTTAPDPQHYGITFEMATRHPGFVFAVAGIHPEYVGRFGEQDVQRAISVIVGNRHRLVGIGETGLDYAFVKGQLEREKQKELFVRFIRLAKELELPIVVHLRNGDDRDDVDVFDDAFEILRTEGAKRVQLHMFGSRKLVEEAVGQGWYISTNAIVLHSKTYGKVARDTPLERLMLETDAPWLHPSLDKDRRNDPTHVREVAEKIAEIKKVQVEDVISQTSKNAVGFFDLKLR
jgi:TatD DNase family protein